MKGKGKGKGKKAAPTSDEQALKAFGQITKVTADADTEPDEDEKAEKKAKKVRVPQHFTFIISSTSLTGAIQDKAKKDKKDKVRKSSEEDLKMSGGNLPKKAKKASQVKKEPETQVADEDDVLFAGTTGEEVAMPDVDLTSSD